MFRLKKEYRPENPHKRIHNVQIRMSNEEFSNLKSKAALFTDGNVSRWIRAALQNYMPKKSEIEVLKPHP